ncbi:DUF1328 domain-containing protein [Halobacterium rubrum]|uniref:DUF1328 domain-containing protein n=1 Tax=Halobacterium TaxID=2239 RepID=UPI001F1CF8ED|nr:MULTISPECIES: DUF1328 domain-containing protein [Halobacterium]MDH5020070.1 DUF1328 domain-containing protein [Halobacterium rubrum]
MALTSVAVLGGVPLASAVDGLTPLLAGGNLIELAILFLVLAVVAAIFGARGIAGLSMDIAKWLVIIFVVLAVVSFLL